MQIKLFKAETLEDAIELQIQFFKDINVTVHTSIQVTIGEIDKSTISLKGGNQVTYHFCFIVYYTEIIEPF